MITINRVAANILANPNATAVELRLARRHLVNAILAVDGVALARATADAYSHDRYGEAEWLKLCVGLLKRGLTVQQAEAVVRSKHTRWAADATQTRRGTVRASRVLVHLAGQLNQREIDALVEGTFA